MIITAHILQNHNSALNFRLFHLHISSTPQLTLIHKTSLHTTTTHHVKCC